MPSSNGPRKLATATIAKKYPVLSVSVSFSYLALSHMVVAVLTVVLGIALAVRYVRRGEPAPVRLLRAVHNGSVNDYAAFLTTGFLTAVVVLWV